MPYQSLTQDQVRRLLAAIPKPRDRTAMLVAYLHALRVSEVNSIRVRDTAGGYLNVPRLKNSHRTIQPLICAPSDMQLDEAVAVRTLIRELQLGPDDRLFPYTRMHYWRVCQRAGVIAGLPESLCHPHVLKHSIGYHLADRDIPIKDLQTYLGHKSLASTGIYLESSDAKASAAVRNILVGKGR